MAWKRNKKRDVDRERAMIEVTTFGFRKIKIPTDTIIYKKAITTNSGEVIGTHVKFSGGTQERAIREKPEELEKLILANGGGAKILKFSDKNTKGRR